MARRFIGCVLVALALIATVSACGRSATAVKRRASRDAPGVGTEPSLRQKPAIEARARHEILARVGHHTITRAYLEEWTPLEVLFASSYKVKSSVPAGLVPDPPRYRYCIAYLAASGGSSHAGVKPSWPELEASCEHEQEKWERFTLSHLIKYSWIYEEAARMGVKLTPADVRRLITASGVKPTVLEAIGVPPAYQDFVAGAEALTAKIFTMLPRYRRKVRETENGKRETRHTAIEIDHEFYRFYNGLLARWAPKTRCDPEYVVWGCSEYSSEEEQATRSPL